jgi:CubicO group peptidase (beta-lactamase class C family)
MKKMRPQYWSIVVIACCLLLGCNRDRSIDPADGAAFEAFLADEMDAQHISAAAVLCWRGDALLYETYQGLADRENGTALRADHMFLLASVSKTITATAIMQLHEAGHFQLDDPINDHLAFPFSHPELSPSITFRHLLTHTAGIADGPSLDDQYYYGTDSPVDLGEFLRSYFTPGGSNYDEKENFTSWGPGDGFEYSNVATALMGHLVTEISGMDFNAYCRQHIFDRLGMANTFWHLSETDTSKIVRPYKYRRGEYEPLQHYTFTDYPNGGLRSTATDLLKFFAAMANGGSYNGGQLLSAANVQSMLTLQVPDLDETIGLSFYIVHAGEELWGHEGAEEGVSTVVAFDPIQHQGAIVLTNGHDCDLTDLVVSAYRLADHL